MICTVPFLWKNYLLAESLPDPIGAALDREIADLLGLSVEEWQHRLQQRLAETATATRALRTGREEPIAPGEHREKERCEKLLSE